MKEEQGQFPASEWVYRQIKSEIIHGHLVPGDYLIERDLAGRYDVSRTPVREALRRLAHEKLVCSSRNRRVFVADLTLDEIREVCALRESLEPLAAKEASHRISEAEMTRLDRLFDQMVQATNARDLDLVNDLNTEFHTRILTAARMPLVSQMLGLLWDRIARLRGVTLAQSTRPDDALREHEWIITCLRRRQPDQVYQEMYTHVRRAGLTLIAAVKGTQAVKGVIPGRTAETNHGV